MEISTRTDVRRNLAPCASNGTCRDAACQHLAVEQDGRWFIAMGHAGFNTRANNDRGYASAAAAVRASVRLLTGGR